MLVTQLGMAKEFCFTVVFIEHAANYLSRLAILQTLCEPMEPSPLGSLFGVRWCQVVYGQPRAHTEDTRRRLWWVRKCFEMESENFQDEVFVHEIHEKQPDLLLRDISCASAPRS